MIVIPGIVVTLVALMPLAGRWRLGHRFNLGLTAAVLAGIALLTWQAYTQDAADEEFVIAHNSAEAAANRVAELAAGPGGIPPGGALTLLGADPLTQGPRLFADRCASCHTYDGHDGLGRPVAEPQTAADLEGFASREWLTAIIRDASHPRFYGDRNDRMPAFGPDEILSDVEIALLVDWLRDDWERGRGR